MQKREFKTGLGELWLWGEPAAFASTRPLILVIDGAFAAAHHKLAPLAEHLPAVDFLFAHLPGNHCPQLSETSVEAFARAYSEVLDREFPQRPTLVSGESVGALVALAIRARSVKGLLLEEPILRTDILWPLIDFFGANHRGPGAMAFVEAIFGYDREGAGGRDYRYLLDQPPRPMCVVFGGERLGERRPLPALPSLVDEPEREVFKHRPLTRTVTVRGAGHAAAVGAGGDAMLAIVKRLLEKTFGGPAAGPTD
jgi:hypothetical protein